MATCQPTLPKHNLLAREDKSALSFLILANLLYMLILSTMMEIPWVLEGVILFIIHLFFLNILFYLQLFWFWMEKPRTKYG